jgi:hypothetical protein
MATEGGLEAVEPVLMKAAGVEACRTIMSNAAASYDQFIKQQMEMEEYQKAASAQASVEEQEFVAMLKTASANDQEQIVKYATIHSEALNNIEDTLLKQAYMQGAGDAAAMQDSAPPPGEPSPEGQHPEPDGDEGAIPGGGGGAASIEEIAQLLAAMVQSGEIDQQTAEGALQELVQAMQGGAAGGGAPPEGDPMAGGAPPEGDPMAGGAPPEGDPKMAFDKSSALCTKLISSLTAKK